MQRTVTVAGLHLPSRRRHAQRRKLEEPVSDQPLPSKLGKYEVVRELDRGAMGIVYLGHDPFVDRPVAIKVALDEALANPDTGASYRRMFFNEAHAAGRLRHPNIIGIYDAGVDAETCYIVMEYVPGGATLRDHTRAENLLPLPVVVEIIYKCARALDYAHRQGVVHRDIKPSNILLTAEHDVKLGDFSIAHINKLDGTETMPMGMAGSPRYMSPEQVNEDYITHHTDIFSLGLVAYELLTGRHAFPADSFSRLVQKILYEQPVPLRDLRPDLPASLVSVIEKSLHKDREQRWASGFDMAAALNEAFSELLEQPTRDISDQERYESIARLDFFQGFPTQELWEIVRAASWLEFADGETIIVEGDLDDSFYVITGGAVVVRKLNRILRELSAGDCFGEMGYLARIKRTATILSRGQTSLLKLNAGVINQVSLNCQVRFLKVFLRTLIHRLSVTTERMAKDPAPD
jgi:eukaryotic-like serine/threonine-protein kinase